MSSKTIRRLLGENVPDEVVKRFSEPEPGEAGPAAPDAGGDNDPGANMVEVPLTILVQRGLADKWMAAEGEAAEELAEQIMSEVDDQINDGQLKEMVMNALPEASKPKGEGDEPAGGKGDRPANMMGDPDEASPSSGAENQ